MSGDTSNGYWGRKTFCILTGASQGIGRQMAIELVTKLGPESRLLILARSQDGLKETARLAVQNAKEKQPGSEGNVQISTHPVDLGKADATTFSSIISEGLKGTSASEFRLALIIHNAGSLGKIGQAAIEMTDISEWQRYLDLNLISTVVLNTAFLQQFSRDSGVDVSVVNITSLCAVQPFRSMGYYCVGKASREMFFRILAEEEPWIDVLSYSPGPVLTDMTEAIISNTTDEETRKAMTEMRDKKTIVTCEQTTAKFIAALGGKKYKSGGRVDYFDFLN